MGDFTMPSLGADMEAGTVSRWLVKPGDEVHRGDIVAVVETEKSTIEVEIFESGVITEIVAAEGERVPVGTVLAHVGAPGAPVVSVGPPAATPPPGSSPTRSPIVRALAGRLGVELPSVAGTGIGGAVTRGDVERAAAAQPSGRPVRSSPLARRLAAEAGVDLATVRGSGPRGAVVARDVGRAAPDDTTPGEDRRAALRSAVGGLMARSKREIPHYYLSTTVDLTAAVGWLEKENLARPVESPLILAALLIAATARAVAKVPEMNGFYRDGSFTPSRAVHVGVAISLRSGGVIAPAIHDADRLSVDELMAALRDLVGRARSGVLRSSEMSDPTITVTNLGDQGVDAVFGVIYPPQVALVGFGRPTDRVVAREGMLGVRPCLTATLSADHRVSDGHRGGRFLAEIDHLLQSPGDW